MILTSFLKRYTYQMIAFCFIMLLLGPNIGQAATSASSIQLNRTVAVVNGELITMFQLQKAYLPEFARRNLLENDPSKEGERNLVIKQILDSMVTDILMRQEAEKYKISVSDKELDNEVRMIMQRNKATLQQFENHLATQGTNLADFKENLRKEILRQRMVNIMISRKIFVTKEEIASYYESHKNDFDAQSGVDLSIIVFAPTSDPDKIRNDISSGKIRFDKAAEQYSIAGNAIDGGRLGVLEWSDVNNEWKTALTNVSQGEVSQVLDLGSAKAILFVNRFVSGSFMTLEEASPRIEQILSQPKLQERFEEYRDQLQSKAVIDIRI